MIKGNEIPWAVGQRVKVDPFNGVLPTLINMFGGLDFTIEDEIIHVSNTHSLNIQCKSWEWMSEDWLIRKGIDYD